MEEYFFGVVVVVAHIVAADEEVTHIVVVDEEVVQPFDVVEEVVQELNDSTKDSSVVLYLSLHVHGCVANAVSWKLYSLDAFCNRDLSYLRMAFDC